MCSNAFPKKFQVKGQGQAEKDMKKTVRSWLKKNGRKNEVIPLTGIDSIWGIESGTDKINYINHLTFSLCPLPVQQSGTNWAATECAQRS